MCSIGYGVQGCEVRAFMALAYRGLYRVHYRLFRKIGPMTKNQMEKNMEHEMSTRILLGF